MAKTFILSTEKVNSYGFVVDTAKLHLERFKANPVMLYNHKELVGKWENIRVENGQLMAEPVFMKGDNEELANKISKRVEDGFVNGASIGLNFIKMEMVDGVPHAEVEIMETSVVDVPSNEDAVQLLDASGTILTAEALQLTLQKFEKQIPKNKMKLNAANQMTLGLEADATETQINAAVVKLAAKNTALEGDNTKLQKQVDDVKDATETARKLSVETTLKAAVKAGKITAPEMKEYEDLAATSMSVFEKTIAKLQGTKKLPIDESSTGAQLGDRSKWTASDYRKKDTPAFLKMKEEDFEQYKRLNAAEGITV